MTQAPKSRPVVELHARSAFSFLQGASSPEELAQQAAELGLEAVALCDINSVAGIPRFHRAARSVGVRPLIGAALRMEGESILPVLVRTRSGYEHLCRLLTRVHLRAPKNQGRVRWEELNGCGAAGLSCLTGGMDGPLAAAWWRQNPQAAAEVLRRLIEAFGPDQVWVEVQNLHTRQVTAYAHWVTHLARSSGLPVVATGGALMHHPSRRPLLDAFICLRHHTTLDRAGRLLTPNAQAHLVGPAEMQARFSYLPEALDQARRLAAQIDFSLDQLDYRFPDAPTENGLTMEADLRQKTFAGAVRRYGTLSPAVRQQLEHELAVISRLGFCGYFLIVHQIVEFCRAQNILVQGRGSAANSAVCYSLGITNVDPVGGRLLFERFLNESRAAWPDIDLDLPSGEPRERVIQEVFRRYAPRGAALVANVICYRGRNAMREMGKVLDFPQSLIDRFCELFPHGDFEHTLELEEHLQRAGLHRSHPRVPALIYLYRQALGLPRHLGQHPGGMIISSRGLDHLVPLEPASEGQRCTIQWDKDDCEHLGMIKVDLLGLGMMAVIQECLALSAARGHPVDLSQLPKDDEPTFALMRRADTIGVFQIESRAQMATLPQLKPRCFYDVVIQVAIIRPGPIVGDLVHPYLNRRQGREPIDFIDPRLQPILERTLGVPLFQEQILQMAMVLANYSGARAEELRRAMGFQCPPERLTRVVQDLRDAMRQNGVPEPVQEKMIRSLQSFALYGFPESHAISFALIAYASAWFKVHRTAEFFCALLNHQPMGFYSPATLIHDAKRHQLRILPVDICHSMAQCTVVDDRTLRLGLNQVAQLRQATIERILQERARAPWRSLTDFLRRTHPDPTERRILARIGALNALAQHRRDAQWKVETTPDDHDLFEHTSHSYSQQHSPNSLPVLPAMTAVERLQADYEGLGLSRERHPMSLWRQQLKDWPTAQSLKHLPHGTLVDIAGQVICRQRPGTAKGHVFLSLEDESGIINVFVHRELFEKQRLVITLEPFLHIRGRVQNRHQVLSIQAQEIYPLSAPISHPLPVHHFH